jgi:hypothetical protein
MVFSSPSVVPLDCCRTCCGMEIFGLVPVRDQEASIKRVANAQRDCLEAAVRGSSQRRPREGLSLTSIVRG